MINVKTFVVHVKGNEERRKHIEGELGRAGINFEFMLDGNMDTITPERLEKFFSKKMKAVTPQTSCAIKHLLIYEKILEDKIPQALIFEDDIVLAKDFGEYFERTLGELKEMTPVNYLTSYENTTLRFVKASESIPNKLLYPKDDVRCTGAYLIDLEAARSILSYTYQHKCHVTIDHFHKFCFDHNVLKNVYWCHPPIAEQMSHNGLMKSLIDEKKYGYFRRFAFFCQKLYKKILYKLR